MRRTTIIIILLISTLCILVACITLFGQAIWNRLRPAVSDHTEILYQGVKYSRIVRNTPHRTVFHVVEVDLRDSGISFLVTPGDPDADLSLRARTTTKFLTDYGLQLAINGDAFTPWTSNGIFNYYPHTGDLVEPVGLAASRGEVYSNATDSEPVLYITKTNRARFNQSPGKIYNAISGNRMIVLRGKAGTDLEDSPQPRTAVGLDKRSKTLYIVVADGRQPGYSQGATLQELADFMIDIGAYTAMNLDGGGSSTLVKEGALNRSVLLNSPIEHNIPGRQRVVGNHLGIYARPKNAK